MVTDWWDSGYSTQLLTRVDDCLAQLFIYTRFMKIGLAMFMAWRHPSLLFPSFLLPLKFQSIPTLLEIFYLSVNILLNILCMNIQIFTMLCPGHVKIMKIFVTVTQIMMESNMVFTCHYCRGFFWTPTKKTQAENNSK